MLEADNVIRGYFGRAPEPGTVVSEIPASLVAPPDPAEYGVQRVEGAELEETVIGFQGLRRYCARETVAQNYPVAFLNKLAWLGVHVLGDTEHPLRERRVFYGAPLPDGITPLRPWLGLVIERFADSTDEVLHELQYVTENDKTRLEVLAESLVKDFTPKPNPERM